MIGSLLPKQCLTSIKDYFCPDHDINIKVTLSERTLSLVLLLLLPIYHDATAEYETKDSNTIIVSYETPQKDVICVRTGNTIKEERCQWIGSWLYTSQINTTQLKY